MLHAATGGDEQAASTLFPLIYDELRGLAAGYMGTERTGHTLQPTALVHEAFLRLLGGEEQSWASRGHFFSTAARAMRRILIDHARSHGRLKRGHDRMRVPLDESATPAPEDGEELDLLALDRALTKLAELDPVKATIVELRFFGGLPHETIAQMTDSSERSVRRAWTFARAWLRGEIAREDSAS